MLLKIELLQQQKADLYRRSLLEAIIHVPAFVFSETPPLHPYNPLGDLKKVRMNNP